MSSNKPTYTPEQIIGFNLHNTKKVMKGENNNEY